MLPLEDFPLGDSILAINAVGDKLGDIVVPDAVTLCAAAPQAMMTPGCLQRVELGNRRRSVAVVIQLP
jgi:hypothetical protein